MVHETEKTNSGIHTDSNGDRVIGGSLRADGSIRKVVKVREGYTPAEDIERYKPSRSRNKEDNNSISDDSTVSLGSGKPKSRFGGLNALLSANNESNGSRSSIRSNTKIQSTPKKDTLNLSHEIDSLTEGISSVKLEKKDQPKDQVGGSLQSRHQSTGTNKSSQNSDETHSTPKKSYKPPHQRKKKMSLEELNKSLGIKD
ncbi:hypothetical protein WICPIJ_009863 [Wickerhamomyces pijperi]|uniref:WIBG Mago-binding domain-containing protein n=1 Tax=Wickerhamomyces pijperi TaxID=599730 RepID=A0A9P8PL20_WICPI|nr:hypothetical protein WICPIJ_009863 [Wickerhamomyces pijperi]